MPSVRNNIGEKYIHRQTYVGWDLIKKEILYQSVYMDRDGNLYARTEGKYHPISRHQDGRFVWRNKLLSNSLVYSRNINGRKTSMNDVCEDLMVIAHQRGVKDYKAGLPIVPPDVDKELHDSYIAGYKGAERRAKKGGI